MKNISKFVLPYQMVWIFLAHLICFQEIIKIIGFANFLAVLN